MHLFGGINSIVVNISKVGHTNYGNALSRNNTWNVIHIDASEKIMHQNATIGCLHEWFQVALLVNGAVWEEPK
jgi:hypothetical protein